MNKADLKSDMALKLAHVKAKVSDIAILTDQDFIDIYGDNQKRTINGEEKGRADILATAYNLNVTQDQSNYTFTRL